MKEWKKKLEDILRRCDLSNPEECHKAVLEGFAFAKEQLCDDPDCNLFLEELAQRTGSMPIHLEWVTESVEPTGQERLHGRVDEHNGINLYFNRPALRYVAKILENLSRAKVDGEHVHFFADEEPLTTVSLPMVVYLEPDEFFDQIEEKPEEVESTGEEVQVRRVVDPQDIIAIQIMAAIPPLLGLTPGKTYPARWVGAWHTDAEVWHKEFGEPERAHIFEFEDNTGKRIAHAFNLDDPTVSFITRGDMELLHPRKNNAGQ